MKSPKPEKANPNQPKTSTAALEEQRLADFLVRHLIIDKDEAHLASPKEGDPPGPAHLLQRLRLRGLITTNQAQRLLASLDDVLGQGIPGYELLERIGQGSTSLVFKARQTGADRMVALKIMPNRAARHASESDMFLALAKSWAKLRHPRLLNTIPLLRFGIPSRPFHGPRSKSGQTLQTNGRGRVGANCNPNGRSTGLFA